MESNKKMKVLSIIGFILVAVSLVVSGFLLYGGLAFARDYDAGIWMLILCALLISASVVTLIYGIKALRGQAMKNTVSILSLMLVGMVLCYIGVVFVLLAPVMGL